MCLGPTWTLPGWPTESAAPTSIGPGAASAYDCSPRWRAPARLDAMDFDLSDDHRLLRDTVRQFAEAEIAPVAEELDRTKSFPYEIVSQLGKLDLMGIPFPQEYGGAGGDSVASAGGGPRPRGAAAGGAPPRSPAGGGGGRGRGPSLGRPPLRAPPRAGAP